MAALDSPTRHYTFSRAVARGPGARSPDRSPIRRPPRTRPLGDSVAIPRLLVHRGPPRNPAEESQDVGDSGTSAPSLAGQVPLPPRVEHQQGPEDLLMIPRARDMLSDEPGRRTRIEESDASDLLRIQACLEHAAQRATHP